MAAVPRAEESGELAAFDGGPWAPRSSLLPVLSGGEWSLARALLCPSPREFGGALLPALALSVTCLLACLQDMSWMLIQHRRGEGGAVCSFPCSKGAEDAPATLGCFRRLEERWQSFSWELAGLCLAPSWSFHATCHAEDTVRAGKEGPGVCGTPSPICGHFCGFFWCSYLLSRRSKAGRARGLPCMRPSRYGTLT